MNHFFEKLIRNTDKNHLIIPLSKPSVKGTITIEPIIPIDWNHPLQLIRIDPKKIDNDH